LAAGKPTVVIPFANDEFDNASRVRRLGTSVTLRPSLASASRLAGAFARVLPDPVRGLAAKVGIAISNEAGPANAAAALEGAISGLGRSSA
jgi:rhamnosyltransferase subunit B